MARTSDLLPSSLTRMLPSSSLTASCGALKPCSISRVLPVLRSISLHRAGEPARQQHVVALGGGAHRIFQRHAVGMHAAHFGDFAGGAIDGAIGEHVGDIDGVFAAV